MNDSTTQTRIPTAQLREELSGEVIEPGDRCTRLAVSSRHSSTDGSPSTRLG